MGLFKKKDKVIDLTGYYERNKERIDGMKADSGQKPEYQEIEVSPIGTSSETIANSSSSESSGGFFDGFFGGGSNSNSSSSSTVKPTLGASENINPEEKRRKLAKRLQDMTEKMEDLSNQIYHLQQRLELVERKLNVNRF